MTALASEIIIPDCWLIGGEVPLGLLSFLSLLSANDVNELNRLASHKLSLVIDHPLQAGPVRLRTECRNGMTNVRFMTTDGTVLASSLILPTTGEGQVAQLPLLKPDDLLDYEGCVPGLSSMFRARPLPITTYNRGTSHAWMRPVDPRTVRPWACMTALDAWANPIVIDHARDVLDGRSTALQTPRTRLRQATVTVHSTAQQRHLGLWLLRHSEMAVTTDPRGSEHGFLADIDGNVHMEYSALRSTHSTH